MKAVKGGIPPEPHPTLKMAHLEILEILKKHEITGVCVLHLPGHMELVQLIEAPFTCIRMNAVRQLQIVPPLIDPEHPEVAQKKVVDTINMLANTRFQLSHLAQVYVQAEMSTRKHFNMMPPMQPTIPKDRKN